MKNIKNLSKLNRRDKKVRDSATFYTSDILGIDYKQTEFVYKSILPYFKGDSALELGPASGYMTKYLINDFKCLHLVEGSYDLINKIPDYENIVKHCSMFENFETNLKFDTIILSHVLEHIEKPVEVLSKIKNMLSDDGVLIVSVPNAQSLHRIVAVNMRLLKTENELNERDVNLGHYRVYDMNSLSKDVSNAGFKVIKTGGSFLKPLPNSQIDNQWTPEMMDGFFEAGKQFPENCAEIFVICSI